MWKRYHKVELRPWGFAYPSSYKIHTYHLNFYAQIRIFAKLQQFCDFVVWHVWFWSNSKELWGCWDYLKKISLKSLWSKIKKIPSVKTSQMCVRSYFYIKKQLENIFWSFPRENTSASRIREIVWHMGCCLVCPGQGHGSHLVIWQRKNIFF